MIAECKRMLLKCRMRSGVHTYEAMIGRSVSENFKLMSKIIVKIIKNDKIVS